MGAWSGAAKAGASSPTAFINYVGREVSYISVDRGLDDVYAALPDCCRGEMNVAVELAQGLLWVGSSAAYVLR
jgi:hypothetical protein